MRSRLRAVAAIAAFALLATACGARGAPPQAAVDLADWDTVVAGARDQTVRWWMFGGDQRANTFVDEHVRPAAQRLGVVVERVPVSDTADAVRRVLAERDAARQAGSVDLIWINGENFAAGREADLWLQDWATRLPNAALVDWHDETIATDFGVPVDGQSSPWNRAAFVFAHDRARTPQPPSGFDDLLAWARRNPGRFTYPAPPDFTGSAFVRQAVQALGEDEAFALLAELKPLQWRQGEAFPASEAELNQLFGDNQVDVAMSYDPTFVATGVLQGVFPATAAPFVLDDGTLQNTSYVTIPASAGNLEGALVVADLLLDPELQAAMADPSVWGMPPVVDLERLPDGQRRLFADLGAGEHMLADLGTVVRELPARRVEEVDRRWRDEVLR